jgi:hypothetical protein
MDKTRKSQLVVGTLVVAATGLLAAAVVTRTETREVTLPAGTRIIGALEQTVSTKRNAVGDRITITSQAPMGVNQEATLPAGVSLSGEVTHIKGGGRLTGAPEITIRFTRLEIDGREYSVSAEPFRIRGRSSTGETAAEIGGGAVVGGVVGAIAGDVVKGAVIGAVLGTGVAVATDGDDIVLRSGRQLRVQLTEPVVVKYKPQKENDEKKVVKNNE